MRILLLNLRCDVDYPPLAFVEDWVAAIAGRADTVTVVTNYLGRFRHPPNVRVKSLGAEMNTPDFVRLWRLYWFTLEALTNDKIDLCFAHMTPMFAALVAPIFRICGRPIVLWYAHGKVGGWLKAAALLVNRCVTSSPAGFQLPAANLRILQQGISVRRIVGRGATNADPARFVIVNIGRISALKRLEICIYAIALLDPDLRRRTSLNFIGDPLSADDIAYSETLKQLIITQGLEQSVFIKPSVAFEEVAGAFARADVAINCAPLHSVDKAALEAMAAGLPCVVTNPSFIDAVGEPIKPLLALGGTPQEVAGILTSLAQMSVENRKALGRRLADIVIERHSLDTLVARLFSEFEALLTARKAWRT